MNDEKLLDAGWDEESVPRRLLNERDNFIVSKGLWSEFVDSLKATDDALRTTPAATKSAPSGEGSLPSGESVGPVMPDHGGADAGVGETPMQRAEKVGNKIFYSGVHAASAFAISAIAEEIESAVDAALSHQPAPVAANVHTNSKAVFEARRRGNVFGRFVNEQLKKACDDEVAPVAANASAEARLREALRNVQKIISEAALTGFNYKDGDWADRLFASQQTTSAALSTHPHANDCDKHGE